MTVIEKKISNSIYLDSFLNIFASLMLTFGTQIIAYPFIARMLPAEQYGLVLTIMGIVNSFAVSIGNTLNNTRLLLQPKYEKLNFFGDYKIILYGVSLLTSTLILMTFTVFLELSFVEISLLTILTLLIIYRAYYSVEFRIIINFKKILMSNFFGLLGYIVGVFISIWLQNWILIFLTSEIFSCIFIYFNSNLRKEAVKRTTLFKESFVKFITLLASAVIGNAMIYMDRFLLLPILGAELVSIYTVASFLGKTTGIIMGPISGVLLSYYAREESLSRKRFIQRLILYVSISVVIYFTIVQIGPFFTRLLYPSLISKALPIFNIANFSAILLTLGNTIQPTLLRYSHERWQVFIQLVYISVYLLTAYFGMTMYGLIGFCYAIAVANLIRIIMMITIAIGSLK